MLDCHGRENSKVLAMVRGAWIHTSIRYQQVCRLCQKGKV